jgi:hypothetical protein
MGLSITIAYIGTGTCTVVHGLYLYLVQGTRHGTSAKEGELPAEDRHATLHLRCLLSTPSLPGS